jgi:type II secretory pathway pseudopilin PulG
MNDTARDVTPGAPPGEAGFSLIQVLVAAALLALAALSLSATQISSMSLSRLNRETAIARQVARQILEEIQDVPAEEAYARFNSDPSDDPGGAGTAVGPSVLIATEAGDMFGIVSFPGGDELREDVVDDALGMPMDLNADGTIDDGNHATDYRLLPVRIRVQWTGSSGAKFLELHAILRN